MYYSGMTDKSKLECMVLDYNQYKNQKLGDYINKKILEIYKNAELKDITGRKEGFKSNGFLYNKQKFYDEVLKWSRQDEFNYENNVTVEAKKLIDEI